MAGYVSCFEAAIISLHTGSSIVAEFILRLFQGEPKIGGHRFAEWVVAGRLVPGGPQLTPLTA